MSPRQRRGLLLLVAAAAVAVLVFASVLQYTADVARELGPRRSVLVVVREIPAYTPIDSRDLEVRSVPEVFAPPTALQSPEQIEGRISVADISPGSYLQEPTLEAAPAVGVNERELAVETGSETSFGATIAVGDRVDVLVTQTDNDNVRTDRYADIEVVGLTTPENGEPVARLALPRADATKIAQSRADDATLTLTRVSPRS